MGSNSIEPFSRQSSDGLGWVDQWDYKYNDSTELDQKKEPASKKEKMAEVSKKAKAAASTGYAKAKVGASKAKVGASVAATKMTAGVGWIKQQVDKRRKPK